VTDLDHLQWIALTKEEPLDPRRRIVDAHHHLRDFEGRRYLLDDLLANTGAGHNVTEVVFAETNAGYRQDGPGRLRPVGETEFVAAQARKSEGCATRVAVIVSFADLTLGDEVEEVLEAHEAAGDGYFRGIRHATAWDPGAEVPVGHHRPPAGLMADKSFGRGVYCLGDRGYAFDAWLYHPQLPELYELARSCEGTTIVIDHLGAPLNVGPYRDRDAVRSTWRDGMSRMAGCDNVNVKLGGIGQDRTLFRTSWSFWPRPPDSDQVVQWWGDDIRWCIDTFGPRRCMFESNYPVDRQAIGYTVLWNAFQKIASTYSDDEQNDLFAGSASRVYRIALNDLDQSTQTKGSGET
jgi:predicted TIM-barrel fold metal-dependent hydrolase